MADARVAPARLRCRRRCVNQGFSVSNAWLGRVLDASVRRRRELPCGTQSRLGRMRCCSSSPARNERSGTAGSNPPEKGSAIPFVIMTAHGDVPSARAAFRADAIDFIEKLVEELQLKTAIETASEIEGQRASGNANRRELTQKLGRLTPRELQVLEQAARASTQRR